MKTLTGYGVGLGGVILALAANFPAQAKTPHGHQAAPIPETATIVNSGSGGLPGYRIIVASTGRLSSVTLLRNGRPSGGRKGQVSPVVAARFFSDLKQAGSLDALPQQSNSDATPPDIAPNVRVSVLYHGRQSPNLRQSASSAGATLYQDVKQIAQALRLPIPDTP